MTTIDATTDSLTAVKFAVMGGYFRIVLDNARAKPGARSGRVLDSAGNFLGSASDYIYGGRGFAVSTRAFGGFVPVEQIEFVPKAKRPAPKASELLHDRTPHRETLDVGECPCVNCGAPTQRTFVRVATTRGRRRVFATEHTWVCDGCVALARGLVQASAGGRGAL